MNREKFKNKLKEQLNFNNNEEVIINDILEEHFLIGKNNKLKIITKFMEKLKVDEERANEIYDVAMAIIASEIKNKLRHPFGQQKES